MTMMSTAHLPRFPLHKSLSLVDEKGKQILFVDCSNCSAGEVEAIAHAVPDYVTGQPLGSVLVLVDCTGASIDAAALRAIKEAAVFDKPYIKKTAWLGTRGFLKEAWDAVEIFSGRKVTTFNTRQEALTWLVAD